MIYIHIDTLLLLLHNPHFSLQRFRGGARLVTGRVAPVFGGCIWFRCSQRMAARPDVLGGTGSDCAGAASFPGRRDGVAGQAGAGRAHSRCQQARKASFQGQVRLIFSTRARAWRTSRAGRLEQPVAQRVRLGVLEVVAVVQAQQPAPGGQVGGEVGGQYPAAVDLPRFSMAGSAGPSSSRCARRRSPRRRARGARRRCTAGDGCPGRRRSRCPGCSCR